MVFIIHKPDRYNGESYAQRHGEFVIIQQWGLFKDDGDQTIRLYTDDLRQLADNLCYRDFNAQLKTGGD